MALLQKSKAPQAILKNRGGRDPRRISQGSHDNTRLSPVNKDKLQLERLQELAGDPRKQPKEPEQQAAFLPLG